MYTAIISGKSRKDIQLLNTIAQKMGIKAKFLNDDDMEGMGIARAIIKAKTDELVNEKDILNALM